MPLLPSTKRKDYDGRAVAEHNVSDETTSSAREVHVLLGKYTEDELRNLTISS
jgi:hypothetical protein